MELEDRLREVRAKIAEAASKSDRSFDTVTLLAVTKTFPVETLQHAYDLGLRAFGENRVQEALSKMDALPSDIQWHLIGQLQTNKINKTLDKFVMIQSIDSIHIAQGLSTRLAGRSQDVLLEVNTSGETSKSGVSPEDTLSYAQEVAGFPGLNLRGLMTVGPLTDSKRAQREAFKKLKGLFEAVKGKAFAGEGFSVLSMGMSSDFTTAIEEGSTLVRIGSALFGKRA